MTNSNNTEIARQGLFAALKEAQDMVRSYDTKAQIVGVGYIFTINVIVGFGSRFEPVNIANTGLQSFVVVILWILAIIPIVFFGLVLVPTRKVAPKVLNPPVEPLLHVMYVSDQNPRNFEAYFGDVNAADWLRETAYEHLRVSMLRDIKRRRFIRALLLSGISLGLIFLLQFGRTLDIFASL